MKKFYLLFIMTGLLSLAGCRGNRCIKGTCQPKTETFEADHAEDSTPNHKELAVE